MFYRFCRAVLLVFYSIVFRFRSLHADRVPALGGLLIACNHQSFLDPFAVGMAARHRPVFYMARSSLFRNPVFGFLLRGMNAFPVDRGGGDAGAVRQAIRMLKDGHALLVFPEGTRSSDGELGPMRPGPAMIASRSGVPIVPAVIDGSFEAWPRTAKFPRPHDVRVIFGELIPPPGSSKQERREATELLEQRLRELQRRIREMR